MLIDAPSLNYVNNSTIFQYMAPKFQGKIIVWQVPAPQNILEGMMTRFRFLELIPASELKYSDIDTDAQMVYMYSDIDNLFVGPVNSIIPYIELSAKKTNLMVLTEGTLVHTNYWGGILTTDDEQWVSHNAFLAESPGFSSSLFAFTLKNQSSKEAIESLFLNVRQNAKITLFPPQYTVDQPFYNDALVTYMYKKKEEGIEIFPFDSSLVKVNTFFTSCPKDTVILTFCGEPGNENAHWEKLFTQLFFSFL